MNKINVNFSYAFYYASVVFITLQLCSLMTSGCQSSSSRVSNQAKNYRSGRNYFSSSSSSFTSSKNTIRRRYLTLNNGATFQSTTHIHTEDGQPIYGRIIVPFAFGEANTLTISAFWNGDYSTSPLWMFLKAGSGLPTSTNFDKQSISFTSRKYARIRKDFISPGEHTLLIAPLQNMDGITINISILPVTHRGAGNSYWRPDPSENDTENFNIP